MADEDVSSGDPKLAKILTAKERFREFLESAPMNQRVSGVLPDDPIFDNVKYPAVHMHCEDCGSEQTFASEAVLREPHDNQAGNLVTGRTYAAVYYCTAHERQFGARRWFLIRYHDEDGSAEKLGQYPRHDASIDPRLLKLLGEDRFYYRRGRECEVVGYGIGAFGYYRRVVEDVIARLLGELRELIPESERESYETALASVAADQRASVKIEAVKDLLPSSLRIDGHNPLSLLHSLLSEGLHSLDEQEILTKSEQMRALLDYLLIEISEKKNRTADAKEAMKGLLSKADKSNKKEGAKEEGN